MKITPFGWKWWQDVFTEMNYPLTVGPDMPPVHEVQHLRRAFVRLEGIGATNSQTLKNLKRVLLQRIAELEAMLDPKAHARLR